MTTREDGRALLKAGDWAGWQREETDQKKGIAAPPPQKPYPPDAVLLDLTPPGKLNVGRMPLAEAIKKRRSHRQFALAALTLEEVSFLLWATQGVERVIGQDGGKVVRTLRTAPSAGARHPFETYLLANDVTGLARGLYRYLPLDHKLLLLSQAPDVVDVVHEASRGQFVKDAGVTFIWTAMPYRTEWRYAELSYKVIAIDAGHVCQNLYLAATAIGAGTCAIGAYDQAKSDAALGVDGNDEFTIYMAPVGKIA